MPNTNNTPPLAVRMRPKTLDEILGQQHILSKDKLLYRCIQADQLSSIILYGPPGTGKTTIAMVIANTTRRHFVQLNATTSGKKDMERVVKEAQTLADTQKTILFIDEIHRFNKAQQDYLLPFVENGLITLIGATTENPYFEVNKALLSRSRIFELKPLTADDIQTALLRAVNEDPAFVQTGVELNGIRFLADVCAGDVRNALNALELANLTTQPDATGHIQITESILEDCVQKSALQYDKDGEQHYDIISAFIKSMRGSDPDATLYYLACMLEAGEDIKYIARRIMIQACEDVGLADPNALVVATAASLACERIGLPEANLILADAALYVACAPKSNSACAGIQEAQKLVRNYGMLPVPNHLRDTHCEGSKALGHGAGYKYPHDYLNHYVRQQYMPDDIVRTRLYNPTGIGYENNIINHLNHIIRNADT